MSGLGQVSLTQQTYRKDSLSGPLGAKIGSSRGSLDHLVGDGGQRRRHVQANRLRHDQVNHEVELSRPLDRKIGGFRPSKILSTKSPARR
jgi:hypothetical protein